MLAHLSKANDQERISGAKKQIKGKLKEGWGGCYIECVEANLIIKGYYLSVGENTEQTLCHAIPELT